MNELTVHASWLSRHMAHLKNDFRRLMETGFFHVLVITIGVRGAGFLQQIGLARILEPEEYGMAIYVFRLLALVCVAADLGISTSLLKFSAEPVDDERKKTIYRTAMVSVAWSSSLVALAFTAATLLTGGFGNDNALVWPLVVGSLYIPGACLWKLPSLYMQAQKQIKQASMISGCIQLGLLALILISAYLFRFWGYLVIMVLGQVMALGVFVYVTRAAFQKVRAEWETFKELARFGCFSMLANFSGVINTSLGVLMLNWLGYDYTEIALYGVANVIANGIRLLPQSLMRTVFPYLVSSIDNPKALARKTNETVLKQGSLMLMITVCVTISGYWLVALLFGVQYQASWPTLVILMVAQTFWSISAGYGQLQLALNMVRLNFSISFIQLIANLALCWLLVPDLGAIGAAAALCFSYMLHTVLLSVSGMRTLNRIAQPSTKQDDDPVA